MSVDVVDSTPIKQRTERTEDLNWIAQFGYFLALFPYELRASYEDEHSPKAGLWKSVGDELVFVADLRSAADAVRHVQAFLDAMANFARHQEVRELRFKATAWTAGFPVGNVALPLEKSMNEVPYEFLGPSVDWGFRLAKLSSPRRMTISVELAWILLRAKCGFSLYYDGRQHLKGIMERDGCPHIWIDLEKPTRGSLTWHEEALLKRRPANAKDLESFCQACIERHSVPNFLPFLKSEKLLGPDATNTKPYVAARDKRESALKLLLQGVTATLIAGQAPRKGRSEFESIRSQLDQALPTVR